MFKCFRSLIGIAMAAFCLHTVSAGIAGAEDPGLKGWETGSKYNSYYDANEMDSFKGRFQEVIDLTPLPGMAPGLGMIVEDQDGDKVTVHLGPKSFVKMDSLGLKKGDKVKVKGVWADINGEEVFIASKVKKSEYVELKVRLTSDGTPFWTMTPEQLAKEQQAKPE